MAIYTNEEIYQLFVPSDVPSNFAEFDVFGSEECLPPFGSQKPENVPDYTQKSKNDRRPIRKPQQQQQPPPKDLPSHGKTVNIGGVQKHIIVNKVEVAPEMANTKISWGKKTPPPSPVQEQPPKVPEKQPVENKPVKPVAKKPVASWGDVSLNKEIAPPPPQPKTEPQPIQNQQPASKQFRPKPQTNNQTQQQQQQPKPMPKSDPNWPSLDSVPVSTKKASKSAWSNIKP